MHFQKYFQQADEEYFFSSFNQQFTEWRTLEQRFFSMENFLTPEQRAAYKQLHKKCKEKKFADRIKSILWLDKGYTFEQIAELLMLNDSSVRRWYEQERERGIESLLKDDYSGSEPYLSLLQQKELEQHLEEKHYCPTKVVKYIW